MNPLPLTLPDGLVFGYVCGTCGAPRVVNNFGAWTQDGPDAAKVAERLDFQREQAEHCCTCQDCGVALPFGPFRFGGRCEPCTAKEEAKWTEAQPEREAEHDVRLQAHRTALARAADEDIALLLLARMRDLSERLWCAGWLNGLERRLWMPDAKGPVIRGFGDEDVTDDMADLQRLAQKAGGWWHWPKGAPDELFITLDDWRALLAEEAP